MMNEKMNERTNGKNELTELVFILDRSGSMAGLEGDTVGGFNALIEKQRKQAGDCLVSVVLFDNESEVVYDRVPLKDVRPMTEEDYSVRGCTALIDALGGAIRHIGNIHKYARREDVPAHTVFVITTDGMENASRRWRAEEVRRLISRKKEEGWEFLFVAANIDAVETASRFGIGADRAVNYHADKKGTKVVYETVAEAVAQVRCAMPLAPEWSEKINEDFRGRKKGN